MTLPAECGTIQDMRFLLSRTDALGDLLVSLPVMERIHSRLPEAEVHWLVQPAAAPVLAGLPGVAAVHLRAGDGALGALMEAQKFDAGTQPGAPGPTGHHGGQTGRGAGPGGPLQGPADLAGQPRALARPRRHRTP